MLRSGVAALFGPQSGTTSSHVQSICDAMEIPHIETRWDYRLKRDDYSVNLYPHPTAISKVNSKFLPYRYKYFLNYCFYYFDILIRTIYDVNIFWKIIENAIAK